MLVSIILNIVLGLAVIVLVCVLCSSYIKQLIINLAPEVIDRAEEIASQPGELKMAMAIEYVYEKIPSFLRLFVSKEDIRKTIQNAFDKINSFAAKQLDKY